MDLDLFGTEKTGSLVAITGSDPTHGAWQHAAFVPAPLPITTPALSPRTHRRVAEARAALAALDSTARQLPNPQLLRQPSLRREAQSTSALEGTYAPLEQVLTADLETEPAGTQLREVLNYISMAQYAFDAVAEGRPLSVPLLTELQAMLVDRTPADGPHAGRIRDIQVVIGRRPTAPARESPVHAARFVPAPPGDDLTTDVRHLLDWMTHGHREEIDPVVAAAMAH